MNRAKKKIRDKKKGVSKEKESEFSDSFGIKKGEYKYSP